MNGPNANLDLGCYGASDNMTAMLEGTANGLIGWNRSGGGGEMDFITNRDDGSIGGFQFYDYNNGTANALVTITGSGNVGIGIPNPAYALDVNGDINISANKQFLIDGVRLLHRSG